LTSPGGPRPEALTRFIHRFEPARGGGGRPTLLLLHGTGGDENDLVALAEVMAPGAALLGPRGRVLENGMPRFFRRIREGVFDIPDLKARATELAEFVGAARPAYDLGASPLVAVGFSNGANIAGALLLAHAGILQGAILLRPMTPYEPDTLPSLEGVPVLLGAGTHDPYGTPEEIERLEGLLRRAGARVSVHRADAGHNLTRGDIDAAREWLEREFGGLGAPGGG
jgi:phospholipase/carboxylesterase